MKSKKWGVRIDAERHTVIANWNSWGGSGELWIDGRVVHSWNSNYFDRPRKCQIGDKELVLRWRGFSASECDLYVAGELANPDYAV